MNLKDLTAKLEAILFTTEEPLGTEKLANRLGTKEEKIRKIIKKLEKKYENEEHGITLLKTDGYKLIVKSPYLDDVSDLTPHSDLSKGLLRVLSIIAFHQPVKQSEIVKVIGNRTYEYVKELERRKLIKAKKHKKTKKLTTTPHFEEYFNVKSKDLKQLMENKNYEKDEQS